MQQRGLPDTPPTPPRGRNNAKLKVLVRSHAMREETSPPREPTPTSLSPPCLNVISSPSNSPLLSPPIGPNPLLVLSPSLSRGNSPSPTSTLVPSPSSRHSPNSCSARNESAGKTARLNTSGTVSQSSTDLDSDMGFCDSPQPQAVSRLSPSNTNSNNNKFYGQAEKLQTGLNVVNCEQQTDSDDTSSHNATSQQHKTKHINCDCSNVNCSKCVKCTERNFNNNLSSNNNNNLVLSSSHSSSNTLTVSRTNPRGKLRHQSSSQGSFESTASPCLSRDSSSDQYTDTTGVDLAQFIPDTLNRNAKDRALMLRIEQELVNLAKDTMRSHFKFPPMSSYQRMLVHRCAAYFGMDHNIETSGKCVVVNKTKSTRIPDVRFKEHIQEEIVFSEEPRRSILKRDSNSCEDCNCKSPDRQTGMGMENRRSKSFEEREEEYEKARRRIFNREMQLQNCDSQEDFIWADAPWTCTESESFSRLRLLQPGRLLKVQSIEGKGDTLRPCVAKSYSFGGYGGNVSVLSRGDSVTSTHSAGPRLITKQDSGASSVSWRLSPSSSGYKSQSQRSESITPSPTSTPHTSMDINRQDSTSNEVSSTQTSNQKSEGQLVWAVTDIHNVPKGSVLINPQTGQPVTNQDGSIYHFDPSNPPPGLASPTCPKVASAKPPVSPQKPSSPQKTVAHKERPPSPKRRPPRVSPTKKINLTTTATSPSLPFSPTLSQQQSRACQNFQALSTPTNHLDGGTSNIPLQQYTVYPTTNYQAQNVPPMDSPMSMYQQPLGMVYTGYTVPAQPHHQYDNRVETQMTDMSAYFMNMNISDPGIQQQQPQPMTAYQGTTQCWNQQPMMFYQSTTPTNAQQQPQRFSLPMQNPTGGAPFLSTPYTANYSQQNLPQQQPTPNPELIPIYPNTVQMVYSTPTVNPNAMMYPNPQGSIIYGPNPNMYQTNQMYPTQNPNYPPCTSTPNSTVSSTNYAVSGYDQSQTAVPLLPPPYTPQSQTPDGRVQRNYTPKGNKFSSPKAAYMQQQSMGSSGQSSGGTNSPATTVVAGYYPNAGGGMVYRNTPPETPPNSNVPYGYGVVQPMVFRQLTAVRASPPVTQSSRSPTPADVQTNERQRYSLPPNLYHGLMPYVVQGDPRISSGRGQPHAYRQPSFRQQSINSSNNQSAADANRSYRSRKPRGNKMPNLPPTGKQHPVNQNQSSSAQKI